LETHEVNFAYVENGERQSALVKLVLCSKCQWKLAICYSKEAETNEGKEYFKQEKKRKTKSEPDAVKRRHVDDDLQGHEWVEKTVAKNFDD